MKRAAGREEEVGAQPTAESRAAQELLFRGAQGFFFLALDRVNATHKAAQALRSEDPIAARANGQPLKRITRLERDAHWRAEIALIRGREEHQLKGLQYQLLGIAS